MASRIADLETRVEVLERRLDALEGVTPEQRQYDAEDAAPTLGDGFAARASTHIGRVLLIFGGAYLLRAITEFQFVPTAIGLLLGAMYALFWLFMAYRKAGVDAERADAAFFAGTSVLLILPLLYEATTTFDLLSGVQGTIAVGIYCAIALLAAALRNLRTLAWLLTAGGIATAAGLLVATHALLAVAVFLLLLGLGSLWVVYWRRWLGLQWLGALGANLGTLALVGLAFSERWAIDPKLPFGFAVVVLGAYLMSFTYNTHVRGNLVSLFETVQAFVGSVIVLGSVAVAYQGGHLDLATAGILTMALGVGGYGLAVARETRELRYRNFFYYSYFGLVFLLAGTALLLPLTWAAVFWAVLAIAMAWFSSRSGWVSLSLQCTILLFAAAAGSGLLATGLEALVGRPAEGWVAFVPAQAVVALATVVCLIIPVAQQSERWGTLAGLPQLVVLALSVWEVGGLIVGIGAVELAGAGSPDPNRAVLAALRTAVLSAAAVTLAFSSTYRRWPEARWLVYPVLVLTGIKLFAEDFPNGVPASLFVALAFVGSALLLVARLLRRDAE